MKKLEIVIQPDKLEKLRRILDEAGASGMSVSNIMGCGNQKGVTKTIQGVDYQVKLLPKVKVEIVVEDELAQLLIGRIVDGIATGSQGDGKIFVSNVEQVVRIRTGQQGSEAL